MHKNNIHSTVSLEAARAAAFYVHSWYGKKLNHYPSPVAKKHLGWGHSPTMVFRKCNRECGLEDLLLEENK